MTTRIAFVSDIHSNLEALTAVLDDLEEEQLYCLGDVVGYGASPNEVIRMIKARSMMTLLGNHDHAALTGDASQFNARAAMGAKWTEKQLTEGSRDFLASLESSRRVDLGPTKAYLVHGSPDDPLWEYVHPTTHEGLFGHYLTRLGVRLLAMGHTHVPFSWEGAEGTVFNPGSVGQPRDGDWRASYAVIELNDGKVTVEHRRVEYDVESSAKKIIEAGLPEQFATRLRAGY